MLGWNCIIRLLPIISFCFIIIFFLLSFCFLIFSLLSYLFYLISIDIKKSPPLIGLTLVYAIDNFTGCFIMELIPPVCPPPPSPSSLLSPSSPPLLSLLLPLSNPFQLSLIISSAETYGYMSSLVGVGFLIGSICVSVWGCPKPYGKTIFVMLAIQGTSSSSSSPNTEEKKKKRKEWQRRGTRRSKEMKRGGKMITDMFVCRRYHDDRTNDAHGGDHHVHRVHLHVPHTLYWRLF